MDVSVMWLMQFDALPPSLDPEDRSMHDPGQTPLLMVFDV
jgi:hypothetical protein